MVTEDRIPKIFISYSWSSDEMVLALAERLVSHGIDVVLDKWDLKEGQDKYVFMERCVNDPEITKVLIICDKAYAQKANDRTGGVGDETVIISSELYGNTGQEKFIPIIAEKDEEGNPYVPTYIKTRIYIDLSDEDKFEAEYEKLVRNIYNKPLHIKPALGKRPEWIDEEKTNYFPLNDLIKQIKGSTTDNKRSSCIARYKEEYLSVLKGFYKKGITPEEVYDKFLETKKLRDCYLDFIQAISETKDDYAGDITAFFEDVYNSTTNIKNIEGNNVMNGSETDIDLFKIHLWELFIVTFVYLRHISAFKAMNRILTHTYFLESNIFGGDLKAYNYTEFRHHSRAVEDWYKPTTDQKNKYTLLGDIICNQREKKPIYTGEAIAEADLFLYQIFKGLEISKGDMSYHSDYWFPTFYVYANNKALNWRKMRSLEYCEKLYELFGVKTIDELKERVSRCEFEREMGYNGSFDAAPSITTIIKPDEIGSLN